MNKVIRKLIFDNAGFFFLLMFGIIWRLVKAVPNLTPIGSMCLFAGAHYSQKKSFALVFLTMIVSDFFIGFYQWQLMISVYGSFFLIALLGKILQKKRTLEALLLFSVISSVLFFLITNFTVWAFSSWYQHSLSGLLLCYFLALPFFRNTLISSLFFTPVLFYGQEASEWMKKSVLAVGKKLT